MGRTFLSCKSPFSKFSKFIFNSQGPIITTHISSPAHTDLSFIIKTENPGSESSHNMAESHSNSESTSHHPPIRDENSDISASENIADRKNQSQCLQERINKKGANTAVQNLLSLMESLKALERQESEFQSNFDAKRLELQAEVIKLEERIATGCDSKSLSDDLDDSLNESLEKLNSAKRELAARLRAILSVKRKLDDVPSQSELIQYERRFSELYVHIQDKLRQTRKYYATYNALLEIKELMLKETSLLNSISSQFQDAFTSTAGRTKLIDSMEGVVKGSQQKLEKVQIGLQEEQKVCDALKERYTAAIADQRRCYSLLKVFQEECAKNERLRSQSSV